jgi:hypothetical protein
MILHAVDCSEFEEMNEDVFFSVTRGCIVEKLIVSNYECGPCILKTDRIKFSFIIQTHI